MPDRKETVEVAGRAVTVSNPDKVYFPRTGHTKMDLVRYYLSVADGALSGVRGRPMVLKRFVNGAEAEAFFQKRAPSSRPDWLETVVLSFPSGRTAEEIVVTDAAGLAWVANLGCIDLNPHPDPRGRHRPSGRAARRPGSDPGHRLAADRPRRARRAGRADGLRADRLAEDVGLARHPHLQPDRAALDVHRGAARRRRARQGDRAARAAGRDRALVEGRTARRVRRLQPERQGPHRRVRLLGPPHPRCARVGAAALGRGAGLRPGRVHDRHHARAVRAAR